MNNGELIEYKENFITKIKKFFKRTWGRKDYIQEENLKQLSKEKKEERNSFFNNTKVDANDINLVIEKKKFLEEINGNEEALSRLSIDRLKKLEEYYDNIIQQNNEIIKKLKNNY